MTKLVNKPLNSITPYFVFKQGKKVRTKQFANGFASYEAARTALRSWMRKVGMSRIFADNGMSINRAIA